MISLPFILHLPFSKGHESKHRFLLITLLPFTVQLSPKHQPSRVLWMNFLLFMACYLENVLVKRSRSYMASKCFDFSNNLWNWKNSKSVRKEKFFCYTKAENFWYLYSNFLNKSSLVCSGCCFFSLYLHAFFLLFNSFHCFTTFTLDSFKLGAFWSFRGVNCCFKIKNICLRFKHSSQI